VLLLAVLEGTPDSIFVKDRGGRYRTVNASAARLLGMSPDHVVGRRVEDFASAEVAQALREVRIGIATGRSLVYSASPVT
jgi:PAS domain S-box-containing protein